MFTFLEFCYMCLCEEWVDLGQLGVVSSLRSLLLKAIKENTKKGPIFAI